MNSTESYVSEGIIAKIFLGYLLSSELRMHLNNSDEWKHGQSTLKEVRFQENTFVGSFLEDNEFSLPQIQEYTQELKKELAIYCPNLNIDSLSPKLFSQIFVS